MECYFNQSKQRWRCLKTPKLNDSRIDRISEMTMKNGVGGYNEYFPLILIKFLQYH